METAHFFDLYYSDCLKIHAICADLKLPSKEAKLFSYIHIKSMQYHEGDTCFDGDLSIEITALKIMLGKDTSLNRAHSNKSRRQWQAAKPFLVTDEINSIDSKAYIKYGIEFSLRYELLYRLQFLQESELRRKKLAFYKKVIQPKILDYTLFDVNESFKTEQTRRHQLLAKLL